MSKLAVTLITLAMASASFAQTLTHVYWTGEGDRWGGQDVAWSSVPYDAANYPQLLLRTAAVNSDQSLNFFYDATAMNGTTKVVRMNRNGVTMLSVTLNGVGQDGFEFTNVDSNGSGLLLAGPITVQGGMHNFSPPTAGRSITLTADSAWDIAANSGLLFANILSGDFGVTKTGDGSLAFGGDQLYTGDTLINAGAFGVFGGNATLSGDLTFAAGTKLIFSDAYTLTIASGKQATFSHTSFGIADLVGLDSSVAAGNYTLIAGTVVGTFDNVGLVNAVDIGDGKQAYFEQGSLNLIVVPEPSTLALTGLGIVGLLIFRRRVVG
jgi:autotransporter-associated beta strand protein